MSKYLGIDASTQSMTALIIDVEETPCIAVEESVVFDAHFRDRYSVENGALALGRAAACKREHPATDHAATIRRSAARAIGRTGDVADLARGPAQPVTRGADGGSRDIANRGGGSLNRARHGIGPDQLRIRAARSRGTCRARTVSRGVARRAAENLAGCAIEAGVDAAIDGHAAAAAVDRLAAAGRGFATQRAARA